MVYKPSGVCTTEMYFEIDDNSTIKELKFKGGCPGSSAAIAKLAEGMPVDEVIARLEGLKCGFRSTSCPDQLAIALKKWRSEQ